jgi:hypothetical protein
MKIIKLSSILLLSMFFMWVFMPEVSAKSCRSRTSFGLSFNIGSLGYVVAPTPVVTPAPVVAPAPVYPYPTYIAPAPVYPYSYYSTPVVVERPGVYVRPGFSYSYWRY